jgi:5-methylcytosine-specific restriction protein B
LIIDEINRGNVAKIFGELLTILEKDKREKVQVRLPQSKSWFSVPPNLYIIATMNTADRSIKLLDAALKRRFAFIEILPDPELLDVPVENTNLTLADIMNGLNAKLREFVGRDKQIGHAYFMRNGAPVVTIDELKHIYRYEIIPLIQEYCYDNYQQLADIVGNDFVDTSLEEINDDLFTGSDEDFTLALMNSFSAQR